MKGWKLIISFMFAYYICIGDPIIKNVFLYKPHSKDNITNHNLIVIEVNFENIIVANVINHVASNIMDNQHDCQKLINLMKL